MQPLEKKKIYSTHRLKGNKRRKSKEYREIQRGYSEW